MTTGPAARSLELTKTYGSGDTTVRALAGVTVQFQAGAFTAIMGPSGSGKSTLMPVMAGLDSATDGEAWIGDTPLSALKDKELTALRRDRVGSVVQQFNLLPTLSARENITLPMDIAGRTPDPAWMAQVVAAVGLADRLEHPPAEMSGGQQQRVAVARALLSRPAIVFADEPTGNIDSRAGAEVLGLLRRCVRELGQTVVMVTHDPVAASYADRVVWVNYDADPATSPMSVRDGAAPTAAGEIALDVTTAHHAGFDVVDPVTLLLASGRQEAVMTGTFGVGDSDSVGGASIVAFEQETAERVLGRPGEYDVVRIAVTDGASVPALRRDLDRLLPEDLEVASGAQLAAESASAVTSGLAFFSTLLLAFAGVALFVGGFLIFNTFSMLVAQRQRELAVLRALGASRSQVTGSVLAEALVVGLLASGIGLGVGVLVAVGLRALAGTFGATLPTGPLVVSTRTVLVSFVVGVGITAVAALLPARTASAVRPVEAMRGAVPGRADLRRGTVVGVLLLLPGAGLLAAELQGPSLPLLGAGCLLTFLGVAGLAPLLSTPVARLLGAPLTRRVPGRLGRLNAMRNPRRTATTAAALMVGLAMVSAVSLVGASAKASFGVDIPAALGADLVVQQQAQDQGIPGGVQRQLAALPEVAHADGLHLGQAKVGASLTDVTTLPADAVGRSMVLDEVTGDVGALAPGRLLVARDEAVRRG